MDVQQKMPPILIYYRMRGQAQAIRGLFCYLQAQFVEVHLQKFEEQKKTLPFSVLNKLKKLKIDKSLLPILLDQHFMIYDTYQIMAYLCYKHNHEHLLGITLHQKARVQQLIEIYTVKQPQSFLQFFRFAQYCATHTDEEMKTQMKKSYSYLMAHSQYIKEFCIHVRSRHPQKYILTSLSILDFLFLQTCTYMVGVFYVLYQCCKHEVRHEGDRNAIINGVKCEYLIDLEVMSRYRQRMIQQPFYLKNQDFLESFSIITSLVNQTKAKGIRKMWIGNPRLIQ